MKSPSLLDLISWGTVAGLLQDWVTEGIPSDDGSGGFTYTDDLGNIYEGLGRFSQKIDCSGGGESHESKLQPVYYTSSETPSTAIDFYSVLPSSESVDIDVSSLITDQDGSLLQYLVYWITNSSNSETPAVIKWPYGYDNATLLDYWCGDNANYDETEYFSPSSIYLIGDSASGVSFYDNIDLSELTFRIYKVPPVYDDDGNILFEGVLGNDEYGYEKTDSDSDDDETDSDSSTEDTDTSDSEDSDFAIGNGLDDLTFTAGSSIDIADFTEAGPFSLDPNAAAVIENSRDFDWDYTISNRGDIAYATLIDSDAVSQFQYDFVQGVEGQYSLGASSTSSIEVTNASSTSYSDKSSYSYNGREYVSSTGKVDKGWGVDYSIGIGLTESDTWSSMTEIYTSDEDASYKGSTTSYDVDVTLGSYALEESAGSYAEFLKYIYFEDGDGEESNVLFPGDSIYQQITQSSGSSVSYGSIPLLRSGQPIGGSSVQADNQQADYIATTSQDIVDLAEAAIDMDYLTNWVAGGVEVPEDSSLYDSLDIVTIDGEDYVQTNWIGDFTTSEAYSFSVNTTITPDDTSLGSRISDFSVDYPSFVDVFGSLRLGRSKIDDYSKIYDFDGLREDRLTLLSSLVDTYGVEGASNIEINTPGINWSFSRDEDSVDEDSLDDNSSSLSSSIENKNSIIMGTQAPDVFDFSGSDKDYLFKLAGVSNRLRGGSGRDLVDATESDLDSIFTGDGLDVVKDGVGTTYFDLGSGDDRVILKNGGVKTVLTGEGSDRIKIRSIKNDSELLASVNDFTPGEDSIQSSEKLKCSLGSLSRGRFVQCGSSDDSSVSIGLLMDAESSLRDKRLSLGLALMDHGIVSQMKKGKVMKNINFENVDQYLERVQGMARKNFLKNGIFDHTIYDQPSRQIFSDNAASLMKTFLPKLSSQRLKTAAKRFYKSETTDQEKTFGNIDLLRKTGSALLSMLDRFKARYENGDFDVIEESGSREDSSGQQLGSVNDSSRAEEPDISTTIENASSLDVIKAIVEHSLPRGSSLSEVSFYGSSSDDRLTGNSISNIISGGAGDDTLFGGGGDDFLIGGSGADTFRISSGKDIIVDFEKDIDLIDAKGLSYGQDFTLEEFVGPTGLVGVKIIADSVESSV